MKLLCGILLLLATALEASAQGGKFNTYPNSSTLQSGDLFIFSRGGNGTFNIDAIDQMPGAMHVQPTNSNLTDFAKWGTNSFFNVASNKAVSGLGTAAFTATTDYDALGSAQTIANATSNSVLSNAQSAINTTSNSLQGQITSGGVTLTQLNTTSNSVYGNALTQINTTSNSLAGTSQSIANTSSNAVLGNAQSAINTASNSVVTTGQTSVNTSSNTLAALSQTIANTSSNSVLGNAQTAINTSSNSVLANAQTAINSSSNAITGKLLDASALKASQYVATDGSTNLVSTQNGNNWTNTIAWTHEGTTTNITATFNGTLQSFTCTNGPSIGQDYFIHYAGANGSVSYRFSGSSFNNLHFDYQPKWLAGSNSVITNGVLSLTSYGGTNATQIEAAMKENQ